MDTATNFPADQAPLPGFFNAALPVKPVWLIVLGVLLVLLGALAVVSVMTATIASVYFVAITMVMAGAAEIALGLQSRSRRAMLTWVLLGTLYVGAGVFAIFNPLLAAGVLTLLLGASLVGGGVMRLLLSFQMPSGSQRWWMAISAAVTLLLGIMILAQWPTSSLYILGIFLSVDLIFAGGCWVAIGAAALFANDAMVTPAP